MGSRKKNRDVCYRKATLSASVRRSVGQHLSFCTRKNVNLKKFVAKVRHADAILAKLSAPENNSILTKLHHQCGSDIVLNVYSVEIALAHMIPTVIFLKLENIGDEQLSSKITTIRHALAHAGEYIADNKPNIEISDESDALVFRAKGRQKVLFKDKSELSEFIAQVNSAFSAQLRDDNSS